MRKTITLALHHTHSARGAVPVVRDHPVLLQAVLVQHVATGQRHPHRLLGVGEAVFVDGSVAVRQRSW